LGVIALVVVALVLGAEALAGKRRLARLGDADFERAGPSARGRAGGGKSAPSARRL
jgi:hypothetical protein